MTMVRIDIPQDVLDFAGLTVQELKVELPVVLYAQQRLSIGKSCQLAGMSLWEFRQVLGSRRIEAHYDENDLQGDLAAMKQEQVLKREEVIQKLLDAKDELFNRFGVISLTLFGLFAQNEATILSHVDLLVEFSGSLTYHRYIRTKIYLEEYLQCPVDLGTLTSIKPAIRDGVEKESILLYRILENGDLKGD